MLSDRTIPLCSDQSAMKNVFDFLQDYVPQVSEDY